MSFHHISTNSANIFLGKVVKFQHQNYKGVLSATFPSLDRVTFSAFEQGNFLLVTFPITYIYHALQKVHYLTEDENPNTGIKSPGLYNLIGYGTTENDPQ